MIQENETNCSSVSMVHTCQLSHIMHTCTCHVSRSNTSISHIQVNFSLSPDWVQIRTTCSWTKFYSILTKKSSYKWRYSRAWILRTMYKMHCGLSLIRKYLRKSFGHLRQCSEIVRSSLEIFGIVRKLSEHLRKSRYSETEISHISWLRESWQVYSGKIIKIIIG